MNLFFAEVILGPQHSQLFEVPGFLGFGILVRILIYHAMKYHNVIREIGAVKNGLPDFCA